jgi:hypothetical protein
VRGTQRSNLPRAEQFAMVAVPNQDTPFHAPNEHSPPFRVFRGLIPSVSIRVHPWSLIRKWHEKRSRTLGYPWSISASGDLGAIGALEVSIYSDRDRNNVPFDRALKLCAPIWPRQSAKSARAVVSIFVPFVAFFSSLFLPPARHHRCIASSLATIFPLP